MTSLDIRTDRLDFDRSPVRLVQARPAAAVRDVVSIAGRALRAVPRELESVIPPIFIALFFFLVNIGTLQRLTERNLRGFDIKEFMLPTCILIGVTGVSRAGALVLDIQNGYFDRLLLTPVRRLAILLGHMVADVAIACGLTVPILALAFALGVHVQAGVLGVLVFILMAGLWSLAFAGFGYAIALKTGNPAAVNSSFLLFFPFLFMTSSYVPRNQLNGWLSHVAAWNPVTYVLEGQRSLVTQGWQADSRRRHLRSRWSARSACRSASPRYADALAAAEPSMALLRGIPSLNDGVPSCCRSGACRRRRGPLPTCRRARPSSRCSAAASSGACWPSREFHWACDSGSSILHRTRRRAISGLWWSHLSATRPRSTRFRPAPTS